MSTIATQQQLINLQRNGDYKDGPSLGRLDDGLRMITTQEKYPNREMGSGHRYVGHNQYEDHIESYRRDIGEYVNQIIGLEMPSKNITNILGVKDAKGEMHHTFSRKYYNRAFQTSVPSEGVMRTLESTQENFTVSLQAFGSKIYLESLFTQTAEGRQQVVEQIRQMLVSEAITDEYLILNAIHHNGKTMNNQIDASSFIEEFDEMSAAQSADEFALLQKGFEPMKVAFTRYKDFLKAFGFNPDVILCPPGGESYFRGTWNDPQATSYAVGGPEAVKRSKQSPSDVNSFMNLKIVNSSPIPLDDNDINDPFIKRVFIAKYYMMENPYVEAGFQQIPKNVNVRYCDIKALNMNSGRMEFISYIKMVEESRVWDQKPFNGMTYTQIVNDSSLVRPQMRKIYLEGEVPQNVPQKEVYSNRVVVNGNAVLLGDYLFKKTKTYEYNSNKKYTKKEKYSIVESAIQAGVSEWIDNSIPNVELSAIENFKQLKLKIDEDKDKASTLEETSKNIFVGTMLGDPGAVCNQKLLDTVPHIKTVANDIEDGLLRDSLMPICVSGDLTDEHIKIIGDIIGDNVEDSTGMTKSRKAKQQVKNKMLAAKIVESPVSEVIKSPISSVEEVVDKLDDVFTDGCGIGAMLGEYKDENYGKTNDSLKNTILRRVKQNLPIPFKFSIEQFAVEFEVADIAIIESGEKFGVMITDKGNAMASADAEIQTNMLTYKKYRTPAIYDDRRCLIIPNGWIRAYYGGGNHRPMTKNDIGDFHGDNDNWDIADDINRPSILVCGLPDTFENNVSNHRYDADLYEHASYEYEVQCNIAWKSFRDNTGLGTADFKTYGSRISNYSRQDTQYGWDATTSIGGFTAHVAGESHLGETYGGTTMKVIRGNEMSFGPPKM